MPEILGSLGSGQVVIDRDTSHLKKSVRAILPEALAQVHLSGENFSRQVVDFDRVVGVSTCVVTTKSDEIVFAHRPKRFGLTRFVKNRQPEPSSSVVIVLKKAVEDDTYVLITAFVGFFSEPEPWDRNATVKSVEFWNTHALIWGSEEIVPGTETSVSPW